MAQFTLNDLLTGNKRLFVSIMAQKDDGTDEIMLIDNNGGIKVGIVSELPPGTNNIGSVTISSIPEVAIKNNAAGTPISVTKSGSATTAVTLQPASTAIGAGNAFTVGGYRTLTLEVSGTSSSRTVVFQGIGPSGTAIAIMGTKLTDGTTGSQTTGTGELWRFDVTGLTSFQANLTAVSGGNVTISGVAVA